MRGFAVKLYTREGDWDLVGNNIPVFFIQDAVKFPDLIHAAKQEPDRGFPQAQTAHDNFWDFVTLMPAGAAALAANVAARDFLSDAYAHCKFIGCTSGAAPLLEGAGLRSDPAPDDGFVNLDDHDAAYFIARCRQLLFWDRQRATVA